MILNKICPPALIYLIFSFTQIVIDTIRGTYNTAFLKIWITAIFTILLNYLCQRGLGIISWFIVFIPFILMTLIVSILLLMFGLDPSTGKIKVFNKDPKNQKPFEDWELNTSTTGPGDPMNPTDCAIQDGKCGGKYGECCGDDDLKCHKGKCVVCLSLGSKCGNGDLCCHKGKCGKDGKCKKHKSSENDEVTTTIANNRAGGAGDTPDVPYANGNGNNGKGNNTLKSSQPYHLNIEGRVPTEIKEKIPGMSKHLSKRHGYRDVKGQVQLKI